MIETYNLWNTSGRYLVLTGFIEFFIALFLCIPAADFYSQYKGLPLFMMATCYLAFMQFCAGIALIDFFPYTPLEEEYHDTD